MNECLFMSKFVFQAQPWLGYTSIATQTHLPAAAAGRFKDQEEQAKFKLRPDLLKVVKRQNPAVELPPTVATG